MREVIFQSSPQSRSRAALAKLFWSASAAQAQTIGGDRQTLLGAVPGSLPREDEIASLREAAASEVPAVEALLVAKVTSLAGFLGAGSEPSEENSGRSAAASGSVGGGKAQHQHQQQQKKTNHHSAASSAGAVISSGSDSAGSKERALAEQVAQLCAEERNDETEGALPSALQMERMQTSHMLAQSAVLKALMGIATEFQGEEHTQSSELESRWLMAKAEAMSAKLAVLKQQLLKDTYTPVTVPALAAIRDHLNRALEAATRAHDSAKERVAQFEAAGLGFHDLVKEYAALQEQIKEKEWALRQIKAAHEGTL